MENNELQNIWQTINSEFTQKSKDELNLLLISKAKQTINKFLLVMSISIIVCIGLIVFLTITSLKRQNDLIYLINNITLGIVTIISLVAGLLSWYKIQNNRYNEPLKDWLEIRIKLLSKDFTGKFKNLYIFLLPFLYILTTLSIHVYFEYKPFMDVLRTEESIVGLLVATPIGLLVGYYAVRKIRKYQLNNLEFLKDMYGRLCHAS